jgi:hypothetical protein
MRHLRRHVLIACGAALAGGACKPDLGAAQSFIDAPRVLAVRANPPESRPAEAPIAFDALLVDVDGRVAAPDVGWAICNEPHPPAESNVVSSDCLAIPDEAAGETFTAPLPADACTNFGPLTSKPGARPADPDTTGGYFQPVRATWHSGAGDLVTFALTRILCPLGAIASNDVAGEYANEYHPNVNPTLGTVVLDPDGAQTPIFTPGETSETATVPAGTLVSFEARWDADIQETFKVYDLTTHVLVDQTESLRLSWFATGGVFEHERTGRSADEVGMTFTRNLWRAPTTPGPIHVWMVLRDSRGGGRLRQRRAGGNSVTMKSRKSAPYDCRLPRSFRAFFAAVTSPSPRFASLRVA